MAFSEKRIAIFIVFLQVKKETFFGKDLDFYPKYAIIERTELVNSKNYRKGWVDI